MDGSNQQIQPEKQFRQNIRWAMQVLNGVAILFVCFLLVGTVVRAVWWNTGAELAASLGRIPGSPWISPIVSVIGYLVLLSAGEIQKTKLLGRQTSIVFGILEPLACLMIVWALHFSYSGVLLLALVDVLESVERRLRPPFLCCIIVLYVGCSMSSVGQYLGVIPLQSYLSYYSAAAAGAMQSVLMLLNLMNIVGCVIYLIQLLGHKTAENDRIQQLNNQLVAMNAQLKAYAAETEHMTEIRERNRLAREIHDTLGHTLTGISSASDACLYLMDTSPEDVKGLIGEVGTLARQGMTDVRRSINALRPDVLERKNFQDALYDMVEHIISSTGVEINITLPQSELHYSSDEEDVIYRIVQEGITNAIRHGNASIIRITLRTEGEILYVQVLDNGSGVTGAVKADFGLVHMRERLRMLDGTLDYAGNAENGGFLLEAHMPIRRQTGEKERDGGEEK